MRFQRDTVSVEEAQRRLAARVSRLPAEIVELPHARGRTLADDLYATSDMPPFDRSAMDGFAVRSVDTTGATPDKPVRLRVVESIKAGDVPKQPLRSGEASRIMTGAMIPAGADAVVMFEQTGNPGAYASHVDVKREMKIYENISRCGEEVRKDGLVLREGDVITPGAIAALAAFGVARVPVVRRPRVGILATGDELIEPCEPLAPGKIRNSNTPMLAAWVEDAGGEPVVFRSRTDDELGRGTELAALFEQVDLLLTTGGVSVGDGDMIASFVGRPDAELLFNRVAMRPGSPTTAAVWKGKLLMGLSGNPAACFTGFGLFVRLLLFRLLGRKAPIRKGKAVLASDYEKPCPYPRFLRGTLFVQDAILYAQPDYRDKSGMLLGLSGSTCFVIIPAGGKGARAGEQVEVLCFQESSPLHGL